MATTIDWYGGDGANEIVPAESGSNDTLGHFGANFGFSIRVGDYNTSSFVTNDNGTTNHGQVPNLRWANTSGAYVAGELTATELLEVDNSEATLRIRLITDGSVKPQNASFRAFDRVDIDNDPVGVNILAAEINKPSPSVRGSGNVNWTTIFGSGSVLSLDDKTTASGVNEYYIGITVSPTSIGEKLHGYYAELEYL